MKQLEFTGQWEADCRIGREYAAQVIEAAEHLADTSPIVFGLQRVMDNKGARTGFITTLASKIVGAV